MNVADIAAQLKAARPRKLKVVQVDNTERTIAVPGGRMKWHAAARIVDGMSWSEIFCIDAHGAVCAPPIRQDDSAPAADLEEIKGNPTAQLVAAVVSVVAPLAREIHRAVTSANVELLTKLRATGREEMADIIAGYRGIAEAAMNRGTAYEERANVLQQEVDELRAANAELMNAKRGDDDDGQEANIKTILGALVPRAEKAKAPDGGSNGEAKAG